MKTGIAWAIAVILSGHLPAQAAGPAEYQDDFPEFVSRICDRLYDRTNVGKCASAAHAFNKQFPRIPCGGVELDAYLLSLAETSCTAFGPKESPENWAMDRVSCLRTTIQRVFWKDETFRAEVERCINKEWERVKDNGDAMMAKRAECIQGVVRERKENILTLAKWEQWGTELQDNGKARREKPAGCKKPEDIQKTPRHRARAMRSAVPEGYTRVEPKPEAIITGRSTGSSGGKSGGAPAGRTEGGLPHYPDIPIE